MTELAKPGFMPCAPVSWGELLDKITILQIKQERIRDEAAIANIRKELSLLIEVAAPALREPAVLRLVAKLKAINGALWTIEDSIRVKDEEHRFDQQFIALARSVYKTNDERAQLKKQINKRLGSELIEEKSYARSAFAFGRT
jgi:hypothetical protein